jgi:hypothetical protein
VSDVVQEGNEAIIPLKFVAKFLCSFSNRFFLSRTPFLSFDAFHFSEGLRLIGMDRNVVGPLRNTSTNWFGQIPHELEFVGF